MGMFTFTTASALLLGLAVPLVVLAYRLRKPAQKVLISSLILFQNLVPRSQKKSRVKVPLRYLFEAIALLALVLAISGIGIRKTGEHINILLDNSMSMSSRTEVGRVSRLELAQERLGQFLSQQPSLTTFDLYVLSPELRKLTPGSVSASELFSTAQAVQPVAAPGVLVSGIEQIRKMFPRDRVIVLTDQGASSSGGLPASVTLLNVFQPARNAFVASIREEAATLASNARAVSATIGISNASESSYHVELFVAGTEKNKRPLLSQTKKLSSSALTEVRFNLPISSQEQTALSIVIRPADGGEDSIELDNAAFIILGAIPENGLLFVSDKLQGSAGLERLRFVQVSHLSSQQFDQLSTTELEKYRAIVFHQIVPDRIPRKPALFVLPPKGNLLFPVVRQVANQPLSSWESTHALLLYLNLAVVRVPLAQVFETPPWAQSIARVEAGPILLAGESGGIRFIGSGIELLPFEQAKTPGPSILLLNSLKWLMGSAVMHENTLALPVAEGETIIDPTGAPVPLGKSAIAGKAASAWSDREGIVQLLVPGIYQRQIGGTKRDDASAIAVNAFFPEESNTGVSTEITFTSSIDTVEDAKEVSLPLWRIALLVALVLLLIDMLVAQFLKLSTASREANIGSHQASASTESAF